VDGEALYRAYRRTALVAYAHIFPPDRFPFPDAVVRSDWHELASNSAPDSRLIVGTLHGALAGATLVKPASLEHLFVVPEYWGSGLAQALLLEALGIWRQRGTRAASLEVLAENRRARAFYERLGWRTDGRERLGEFPPYPRVVGYRLEIRVSPRKTRIARRR
jgi:ribosomal protein S18 acetylase RimI-like enzyme